MIKAINKALGKRDNMKAILAANIESVITDVGGISIDEIADEYLNFVSLNKVQW